MNNPAPRTKNRTRTGLKIAKTSQNGKLSIAMRQCSQMRESDNHFAGQARSRS